MNVIFVAPPAILPEAFGALQIEARTEGYRFIDRFCKEWEAKTLRYDLRDEKLRFAYLRGELAAIGGITHDPIVPGSLRMRRFFVRPFARGGGIGRKLVDELLKDLTPPRKITVHAGTPTAALFWDAIGFPRSEIEGITHAATLTNEMRLQ